VTSPTPRRRFDWALLGIGAGIIVALVVIGVGFSLARTGDDVAPPITDEAVERVFPRQGDLVLRQSEVGVDLAAGYRGVLIVDGQEVPTFDLVAADPLAGDEPFTGFDARFDPAQNTVTFAPREGATIEAFEAGDHTVTAVFWKLDESRAQARSVTWRFRVS
jgi:hypothetical protein